MTQTIDLTGYHLSFDDEFNGFDWNGPGHPGVWNTTYAYGERKLNDELQYYADPTFAQDPFSVQNGALVISATPSADPSATWGQNYVSGLITTNGTFSQRYGYFEMRAKLPSGQGLWPAFWMLPVQHVWPPELDVLEAFGSETQQIHWGALTASSLGNAGNWVGVPADVTNGYHRYGVAWTAATLTYYFDGQAVASTTTPSDMNQPMYLLANLAVGGHWPGNPFPSTPFPAQLSIDYIRAYSMLDPPVTAQAVSAPDAGVTAAAAAPPATRPVRTGVPGHYFGPAVTAGTSGNDQFQTFYGDTATRAGGPGDDTYIITDPRMFIDERPGEGTDLAQIWVDYTLPPDVENITIAASWGLHATGNAGSNYVTGGLGDDVLSGGPGGDDVLTGGGGRNVFSVTAGCGRDTITDFAPGAGVVHDQVQLNGFDFISVGQVLAALRPSGLDTVLPFDNGERLTFWNTAPASFDTADFSLANVTAPPVIPSTFVPPADVLTVLLAEDAFNGDAQATVTLDGRQLGGVQTVTAAHGGAPEPLTFTGQFGRGAHTVGVTFLNDAWGGPGQDRNLYVEGAVFDGASVTHELPLYGNGSVVLAVSAPSASLAYTNPATGASGNTDLATYAGPVSYLQWEGTLASSPGLAMATNCPNVFIHTGGNDAIAVTSGQNVLDGGTGSNFLTGGSGNDTFFLDARGGDTIWDTIVNFHAGDSVTLWGFGASDTATFDPVVSGAASYEGLTLHTAIGGRTQSITFASRPVSDSAQLSLQRGSVGGTQYLAVIAT